MLDTVLSPKSPYPNATTSPVDLVAQALNNKIIGRLYIDTINSAIRVIDLREQGHEDDLKAEPESTQVIKLIIDKVKLILENTDHCPTEDFISLFYLTKVIDFPQITKVYQSVLGKVRSAKDSEKKELVENVAKLIPASLSAKQLKEDFSELVSKIDERYLDVTLIEGKLSDIRKRNETKKNLQQKNVELLRFQAKTFNPSKGVNSQDNLIQKKSFPFKKWNFFNDSVNQDSVNQTIEDSDYLENLCFRIQHNPELLDGIEQVKQSMQGTNNDILVFLGTTQVGKSSTLNFLSGQIPFIERGYIFLEDFLTIDKDTDQHSASEFSKKIFQYLIHAGLIGLDPWDEDEDSEGLEHQDSRQQFYVPTFSIGERISSEKDHPDKEKLQEFLLNNFPEKDPDILFKFIVNQLEGTIRKKDRSDRNQPGIGFRNPVFSYGVGLSKTIVAQAKNQSWNTTTIDLPGSDDSRAGEYPLLSAFSTYCALAQTTKVKGAAIILGYHQLTGEATNVANLIKVLSSAENMMGESIEPSNICILVTKTPITKTLKSGKIIPMKFNEIQELVLKELNKFSNLLAHNGSSELLKLQALLSQIIEGKRVIPLTPLKTMKDDCLEKSDPANVNEENKQEIIKMLSSLKPVTVNSGYFSRTYSAQNGNISNVISKIEECILNASSIITNELKSLTSLLTTFHEKYIQISTDILVAGKYLEEIKECLTVEQTTFDNVMEKYLSLEGKDITTMSSISITSLVNRSNKGMKAQEIKDLAILAAKKQAIGKAEWSEKPYASTAQSSIDSYRERIRNVEELIRKLEEKIDRLSSQKPTNGEEERVASSKFTPMNHYFYAGDQTVTLRCPKNYRIIPRHKLEAISGGFSVKTTTESTANNIYQASFTLYKTEAAGVFYRYKMTGDVWLAALKVDVINHEIEGKKKNLETYKREVTTLSQRLEILIETEENCKKTHTFEQEKQKIQYKNHQQYYESLTKLQEQLGIEGDKSQLMSTSDIRKVMIGVLVTNAHKSLEEVEDTLREATNFFANPGRQAKIFIVRSALKNYRLLEDLLLINKALNFQTRYDDAITMMSISKMEKAVEDVVALEESIKKIAEYFKDCQSEIDTIQSEANQLKLQIDRYDHTLELKADGPWLRLFYLIFPTARKTESKCIQEGKGT